jgi:hypothetical protein
VLCVCVVYVCVYVCVCVCLEREIMAFPTSVLTESGSMGISQLRH